jgi:hypothetical protein
MTPEDAQQGGEEWVKYKHRQRMAELESLLILYGVDVVLSPSRGKIVGALEKWEIRTSCSTA